MPKEKKECCCGLDHEKVKAKLRDLGDEVAGLAKKAKDKYAHADDSGKRNMIAALAGAAALLTGAIGVNRLKKKLAGKKKK